jgi:hypothetical protein
MEDAMFKLAIGVTAAATIVAAAIFTANRVEAGASASAPSKYAQQSRANQLHADRGGTNVPITEYSSSTRKASPKH